MGEGEKDMGGDEADQDRLQQDEKVHKRMIWRSGQSTQGNI